MPGIALIYGILVMIFLNGIYEQITRLINFLEGLLPIIGRLNLHQYLIYIVNAFMVLGFLIIKELLFPILKRTWGRSESLMEATSGHFYEYDRELDKWFVQPRFGQVRFYYKGIYIAATVISSIVFVLSQYFPSCRFPDGVLPGIWSAHNRRGGKFPVGAYKKRVCGRYPGRR